MRQRLTAKWMSIIFMILLYLLMVTGCYDSREIDDLSYPLAIGLDIGEANILRLSLQMAAPLAIGEGGGGGGGEGGGGGGSSKSESSSIITVDTPSIYSGLNLINNIVSKEINVSHAKIIVISKELAEQGFKEYLHALQRGREFRPNIYMVISNCPAYEYLENVKPILESNPAKYYELLLGKKFYPFYPDTDMNDFYFQSESDDIQPVAILSDIGKYEDVNEIAQTTKKADTTSVRLEGQYTAGNIPIAAKRQNEFMGMAVFKNDKMIGTTNGLESACYHMIIGEYSYSYWTIPDPLVKDKIVVMNIMQRSKPKVNVKLNDKKANISIHIDLEGDFTSIQSDINYETNPEIMEKTVEQFLAKEITAFLNRTKEEFDSDICGFGRFVKRKFLTWDSWKKYEWFEKYKNTSFEVQVDLKIRRTGLIIKSVG